MSLHLDLGQGLRVDNLTSLQDKVRLRGGRLVVYTAVISAIVFSVRNFTVKWVPSPDEKVSAGIPSMILTAFLGWWSLFGPYRSITALIWNQRGGVDMTDALMRAHPGNTSLLGYADSAAMGSFYESASRQARRICIGLLLLLTGGFVYLVWKAMSH